MQKNSNYTQGEQQYAALAGHLEWNINALGWTAHWRLESKGKNYRWHIREVGFDEAFRSALRGAAQIISVNGSPE